ncbi:FAST kinase domain-containing protein 2, mitochondrial [Zootoca vivipara]|uniref:FAST kinase domain-containing protein 2, mitochondrial n=1 Tax=Zootoca vivipara TaxID=8524 RepID=UPI001590EB68|nr:FAST kinase domain-containing protein 2, mitochondrial [Zootoca vivipara]XP_034994033.1 FAST kinase domain-containing protein 2, mitochondrial [Zootoca vivipara]
MNKNLDCFIRTVRQLQACHYAQSPFSRTTKRAFALGVDGPKSAAPSIYLRRHLSYASPCWLQSSVRFFSQGTLNINADGTNVDEQKTADALLDDHVQDPDLVTVAPTQLPSGFSGSPKEVRSTAEEKDEERMPQQFFNGLQKCTSPSDVLDLASKFPAARKYSSTCLATMWMLTKKLSEDQKHYERRLMFEHPQFSQLCQCVMQEAKHMWRDDLAYSLLAVVKLGVPQNTRLVQTLLRVCQERLNEFDDRCLSVVASTLQGMEKSKNVEALQVGLQLLVEQRIPKISNILMLQNMMKGLGKDAPLTLKAKLENKILYHIDQLTVPNAQHMFTLLAEMNYRSVPILNACSNKIIEGIPGTPFRRLLNILRSCKDLLYRNSKLCSAIADYAASVFYMWDTKQAVLFLSAFENVGFRPVDLMDAFAEKVTSDPECLSMRDLVTVLRAYSYLNHTPKSQKQEFLEALNSVLDKYLPKISNVDLLKAVYSFCILGYFPQSALKQLLLDEILHSLVAEDQNIEQNAVMLHTINACLELDGNCFTKPAALLVKERPSSSAFSFPDVKDVLLTLLGDESLFRANVPVVHSFSVDFEILMDAEKGIVIPNAEVTDKSDIQRIAVLCAPASALCFASKHPRGRLAMRMRHLRLLGYRVILVHYQEFQKLKKDEAFEFLKGEIFSTEAHLDSD